MTESEQQLAELLHSTTPAFDGVSFNDVARRVQRRRTARWSIAGATVAVAAIAVTVSLVGSSDTPRPTQPGTRSSDKSTGPVPWIATPAHPYRPPTTSPSPPATDARPCTANDVTASFAGNEGAGGHVLTYLKFRNTGQSTCLLNGYPMVTATETGLPNINGTNGSYFPSPNTANMPPGQETFLGVETDTYCPARPNGGGTKQLYHHLHIRLPAGGSIALDRQSTGFDLACGLQLTKFFVRRQEQPQPQDPLSNLRVSLATPPEISAGSTLDYVINLSNPTDNPVSLDPCPSYTETANTANPAKESYALNCRPVGEIPAHGTVAFDMRLPIPTGSPTATVTIRWTLYAPGVSSTSTIKVVG